VVLEAKAEDKNPLVGKEQARKYAKAQNCRFVILTNGNLHYFWDLSQGNPNVITASLRRQPIAGYHPVSAQPGPAGERAVVARRLHRSDPDAGYAAEAAWKNEAERDAFIHKHRLRFLRHYQQRARISAIQAAVAEGGQTRFLFEMATGTGKTSPLPPSSSCFCAPATPAACCFWWIGWSWKTRPTKPSCSC
jgi:type I restriction enzyme R subunit